MSVSSLALDPTWRDHWGMWNPLAEAQFAPLQASDCHLPRFVLLPDVPSQVFPSTGKINFNFFLVPGSIIWGFIVNGEEGSAVQLTDVAMGHEFFQEPLTAAFFAPSGNAVTGQQLFPQFCLLPCPHPVVADGLFTFEAWGTPGTSFSMLLGVAEVSKCPR